MEKQYLLKDGRRVFIRAFYSHGYSWAVFWFNGRLQHKLRHKSLPWFNKKINAQKALEHEFNQQKGVFEGAKEIGKDCNEICNNRSLCCMCTFIT